jgi:type II secretory pathway pseudopilin PulG
MKNNKTGFTFLEMIITVGIIIIMTTIVIISFNKIRANTRDAKRLNDIKEIRAALELFFNRNSYYPTLITPGQALTDESKIYLNIIPSNPTPRSDGNCGDNEYTYVALANNDDYEINFCLGDKNNPATQGCNVMSKNGLNTAWGLIGWWKFEERTGENFYDTTGNNNTCSIEGSGSQIADCHAGLSSCQTGFCSKFDGTDTLYLDCGFNDDFLVQSGSISAWFKASNDISDSSNRLIEIGRTTDGSEKITLYWSSGNLHLYGLRNATPIIDLAKSGLNTNIWYHAVGTWDETGAKLYVNNDDSPATISGDKRLKLETGVTKLTIGNNVTGSSGNTWKGYLDDIRVYNRALSEAEIQGIYDGSKK